MEVSNRLRIIIDAVKCTGCGKCVPVCPVRAIEIRNEKAVMNPDLCILCTSCVAECETDAVIIPSMRGQFVRARKAAP